MMLTANEFDLKILTCDTDFNRVACVRVSPHDVMGS
jgi:hypothetical protein